SLAVGTPQGVPVRQRVKEEGGSEGRPVIGRIGVFTPPARGQTSLWCWRTGTTGKLLGGGQSSCWRGARPLLVRPPTAAWALAPGPGCEPRRSTVQVVHQAKVGKRVP